MLGCALTACGSARWDVAGLEARHARLAALGSHRLGDALPYALPSRGALTLFLCRWPDGKPIPVSLPPDAGERDLELLRAALRAWEESGAGVRFEIGAPVPPGIEIRFVEVDPEGAAPQATATTIADCAVAPAALESTPGPGLPAQLTSASVHVKRSDLDLIGREVPLSEEEVLGSVIHELGHALGFQGHALRGDTVMVRSVDEVRRAGRRVLAGRRFRDDTLRALYAVPTGSVVGRLPLSRRQTELVDRLAAAARRDDLPGPFVRVGDRLARLAWGGPDGRPLVLLVFGLREALRDPARLSIEPMPAAAELLSRSGGVGS